jgi:hypothetical protein
MVDVHVSQPLLSLLCVVNILRCMLSPLSLLIAPLSCSRLIANRFFAASGVGHAKHIQDQFRFRRAAFYSKLKSKVGNILAKATALRINLNIDGAPIASHVHTHTHKPLAPHSLPSP